MSWNILKKAITDVIKTNGNEEITGQNLQNTLVSMVNALGDNSTFAGFALPTTNPGNPDGPVFYLANVAGVYSNFSGCEVKEGEAVVLNWDGSGNWSKHTLTTGAGGSNSVKDLGNIDDNTAFAYLANLDNLVTKNDDGSYNFNKPMLYTWNSGLNSNLVINISASRFITQLHFGYIGTIKLRNIVWSLSQYIVENITDWYDYVVTSSRAGFMTPSMLKILEGASGVMGGNAQVIEWSHTHNMNDYKTAGTYRIKGERTGNPMDDNLPIMNQGSGHTIDGILYVLDSSLPNGSSNIDDCTITQFLMLSNRVGGQEGDMYMRSGYGPSKDDVLDWKPWEKYQTNMEVGCVSDGDVLNPSNPTQALTIIGGMNFCIDSGIYSGIYFPPKAMIGTPNETAVIQDPTAIETFVMLVINNYAAAGDNKIVTQIKFSVTNGGLFSMEKRNTAVGADKFDIYYSWSQWESIGGGGSNSLINKPNTSNSSSLIIGDGAVNLKFSTYGGDWNITAKKESLEFKNNKGALKCYISNDGLAIGSDSGGSGGIAIGNNVKIGDGVNISMKEMWCNRSGIGFQMRFPDSEDGYDTGDCSFNHKGMEVYRIVNDPDIGTREWQMGFKQDNQELSTGGKLYVSETWNDHEKQYSMVLGGGSVKFYTSDKISGVKEYTSMPYGLLFELADDGTKLFISYRGKKAELPLT